MQDMRYIEFSPYWNVPPSILRKESIPRLRRDPGYLAREDLEFVGRDGNVSTEVSDATLVVALPASFGWGVSGNQKCARRHQVRVRTQ